MDREDIKELARKSAECMVKAIPRTNYNDHCAAYIQGFEAAIEQMKSSNDIQNVSDSALIDYIENDAEIAMPIDALIHEDGRHLTKKEYGKVLLKYLVKELREHYC